MKYIRTKEGRIVDLNSELVSSYEIIDDKTAIEEYGEDSGFICVYYFNRDVGEHIEYDNKGGRSMDNWYLKDIKFADTIEELCDFAETYWSGDFFEVYDLSKEKPPLSVLLQDMSTGDLKTLKYGIRTDKGLIYVAKVNEKGELELL